MSPDCFMRLHDTLMQRGLLQHTRIMSMDEQLAMLLHILAHNVTNKVMANRFNHLEATVSRYFHIMRFAKFIQTMFKFQKMHLLHNRLEQILDSTHILRHGQLSQNCLMASGFDMKFQYVLAGWEGSATDATVLFSTLNKGD
ncbi:LOW QUALITY PROTEIN: putative nuclease HARBI1 [Cinnamomum micranthum f. kanehirae]|uniref:Putative nuclease HARBI1 n=1 Tax=Cinnamomum micranthum f. kanehirae TaxID=337451 RepID=A0A3S3NEW0_9MAGN|nr:LOW QUALITY PROTEIN: putative nuclease HARBI1 [Cinnamomum micranthum f. kanehirae]